jgi:hypothetical protein
VKRTAWLICLICLMVWGAACTFRSGDEPIPTEVVIDTLATQTVLTENAPPPGWRDPVAFPEIDTGLRELSGWRYNVTMQFEGTFARTPRETSASTTAEVWFDQLGSARRVVVTTASELGGQPEENTYEAVRLGPDAFLVRDGACLSNATEAAETAADLSAGQLVGGVRQAAPYPQRAVINGQEVWRYEFTLDDLVLPQIQAVEDGHITLESGELWIAPEHSAVIRFWVLLDVENVLIFDSSLPVTGQVIMRYDLYDIGVVPNISIPFGC